MNEQQACFDKNRTQRVDYIVSIGTAAEKAGFKTSSGAKAYEASLVLTWPDLTGWEFPVCVKECGGVSRLHERRPGNNVCCAGPRTPHRYTNLCPANVVKIVAYAIELRDLELRSRASRLEAQNMTARFNARRAQELAGCVIPPGVTIDIIMGNGPQAGNYRLRMAEYCSTIRPLDNMTQNQVRLLLATMADIFGYGEKYVVRKDWAQFEGTRKEMRYFNDVPGLSEFQSHVSRATLLSKEQAEVVAAKLGGEAVLYSEASTAAATTYD